MMDKNLHDDIGDKFRDEIEALSQPPRKQVWENLEQQLDKKDAVWYKQKFITLRRVTIVLLFLLISFATITFIYFNNHKNGNEINNRQANNKKTESKNVQQQYDTAANNSSSGINDNSNKKTGNKKIIENSNNTYNKEKNSTSLFINKAKISNNDQAEFLTKGNTIQNGNYIIEKNIAPLSLKNSVVYDTANMQKLALPVLPNAKAKSITDVSKNTTASKNVIKKDPAYRGFSLSFFAAPEKVFYHLKDGTTNPYDNKDLIQNRQKADISFSAGILLGYAINKRWILQSGIGFSYANNNIAPSKIYAEKNNSGDIKYRYNTSTGYGYILPSFISTPAIGDSIDAIRADQTVQYINVPLMVKYTFGTRKFAVAAGAGVSINFLTKAKLNTEVTSNLGQEKESITKLEGVKKINFSLVLAPELQYSLSKKITFNAMPYLKYAPVSVTKGNIVKTYPYNIGFGIGITYKLKK